MSFRSLCALSLVLAAFAAAGTGGNPAVGKFFSPAMAQEQDRESYIRENENRFEEWGKKLDAFAAKAAERGSEAKEVAKRELDEAWDDAKAGWAKLKSAGKEGWKEAKSAFEQSWQKLERAWDDAQS